MTYYVTKKNDELCHFGILGMKWGVRRYQNKDGTLTLDGKVRYGADPPDPGKRVGSGMSDDELAYQLNRLRNEYEYQQLYNAVNSNAQVAVGKKIIMDQLYPALAMGIAGITGVAIAKIGGSIVSRAANKIWPMALAESHTARQRYPAVRHGEVLVDDLYLEHHGILGQKWGVRRYQNKDGSLTEAGKKRYRSGNSEDLANATKDIAGFSGAPWKAMEKVGKERTAAAADLGLEAFAQIDPQVGSSIQQWIDESGRESVREWFVVEDQTIGYATVADLINQGYSAKDVKALIRDVNDGFQTMDDEDYYSKYFDLLEGYKLDEFADACEKVKKSR